MNGYLLFILSVLVLDHLLGLSASLLNLRTLDPIVPVEFAGLYDREAYARSQRYIREQTWFTLVRSTIGLGITLGFLLCGGFNWADQTVRAIGLGPIPTGLLFTALLALLSGAVNLPFAVYATFVLERRYGLSTTTATTFIFDRLKAMLLAALLGGPILAAVLWLFAVLGPKAWLLCWLVVTAIIVLIQFLAPVLILPMFNRFTPLSDGPLKEAIAGYAASQRFTIEGIFTMDGSKRSTRANALFTGLGRFRRIVFFDTLLDQLTIEEIVAVLAHEMGHYKGGHILVMMVLSTLQTGLLFFVLSMFLNNPGLFTAFGMEELSIHASLVFFGFLAMPITALLAIGMNALSRRNEFQADRFVAKSGVDAEALISGLKKLSVGNLTNLTPHPLHVFLNHGHPPVLARIAALRRIPTTA